MKPFTSVAILSVFLFSACEKHAPPVSSAPKVELKGTVLFLGDSITHAGHFVSDLEAVFAAKGTDPMPEFINLGLPSETCTGLSEPDHPWPRPNVHERIDRALSKVKPDLVFACYGMNDGIYHPFDESRFAAYQKGIDKIIEKVHASGAKLILMTPPPFDPEPLRAKGKLLPAGAEKYAWFEIYENYDIEVMAKYAEWILQQHDRVEGVVDLRSPILKYTEDKRKADPAFTLSNDGVHANAEGHGVMAKAILSALREDPAQLDRLDPKALALTESRQRILHAAWLSHVGHKRPGVKAGLPLEAARIAAGKFVAEKTAPTAKEGE